MSLHVLHFVLDAGRDAGSVAILLDGLFNALQRRDCQVSAVSLGAQDCAGVDPPGERTIERSELSTTTVDVVSATTLRSLVDQADVVHFHGWSDVAGGIVADACLACGKPYIISPLGFLIRSPFERVTWKDRLRQRFRVRRLVRRAARLCALNQLEATKLTTMRVNEHIEILPYGIDFSRYEVAGTDVVDVPDPPAGKLLLLLGPVHPAEGFVPFLKAFAEAGLDAEGWSVVIAGRTEGDWRNQLDAAVRRKGAFDRVLFTEAPDLKSQRRWMAKATVLACPSLHHRVPASIMQAVASEVATLASDLAAPDDLREVIFVCPPERAPLNRTLRSLLTMTDEKRSDAARLAREHGRASLDWRVVVDRYVKLYESVV